MGRAICRVAALLPLLATAALADTASIPASKDNTLIFNMMGLLSNGAGQHFFAGATGTGAVRRGVIAFDVAGAIPAGSTITSATLKLNMSRTHFTSGPETIRLRRLTSNWGEGTSVGMMGEGGGAGSTAGDATWIHTFFNNAFWTTAGGDFSAVTSASAVVGNPGAYSWGSTAEMVADVQGWLDNPASNFGWILIGNEAGISTAKRFDSKDNLLPAVHPELVVEFTPGGGGTAAGRVPDGDDVPGVPLTVTKVGGGDLTLAWSSSCLGTDNDYEIYEGTIGGTFTSHAARVCTTGGATSFSLTPAGGDTYYLVVPRNAANEGSYGTGSDGLERGTGGGQCLPQSVGACS